MQDTSRFPYVGATWGCVGRMCFPHADLASISGQPQFATMAKKGGGSNICVFLYNYMIEPWIIEILYKIYYIYVYILYIYNICIYLCIYMYITDILVVKIPILGIEYLSFYKSDLAKIKNLLNFEGFSTCIRNF